MVELLSLLDAIRIGMRIVVLALAVYGLWLLIRFAKGRFLVSTKALIRFAVFGLLAIITYMVQRSLPYPSIMEASLGIVALLFIIAEIYFIQIAKISL